MEEGHGKLGEQSQAIGTTIAWVKRAETYLEKTVGVRGREHKYTLNCLEGALRTLRWLQINETDIRAFIADKRARETDAKSASDQASG